MQRRCCLFVILLCCGVAYGGGNTLSFTDIAPAELSETRMPFDPIFVNRFVNFVNVTRNTQPNGLNIRFFGNPNFNEEIGDLAYISLHNSGGIAVIDFDGDGDDDILIIRTINAPNLLYRNDFDKKKGKLKFTEVAASQGIQGTDHATTGVCYGDVDNDGDLDIVITSDRGRARLYIRNAHGYTEYTDKFPIFQDDAPGQSCSFGDLNGDGYLDLVIAVGGRTSNQCTGRTLSPANRDFLFINDGTGLNWSEEGLARGLVGPLGVETISWALGIYDYDLDGDLDIVIAADQCLTFREGVNILLNNGTGFFTSIALPLGAKRIGGYMSVNAGDLNRDGRLDLFMTNFGGLGVRGITGAPAPAILRSRPFFGQDFIPPFGDSLTDSWPPEANDSVGTPFGWGSVFVDLDNDGDTDIVWHGMELTTGIYPAAENPGMFLENLDAVDGSAGNWKYTPVFENRNHQRRMVRGVAYGDFDNNGFVDIVTVSPLDFRPDYPFFDPQFARLVGQQMDPPNFSPPLGVAFFGNFTNQRMFFDERALNFDFLEGTISIEMNSGNGNNYVKVGVRGTVNGVTPADGYGAIIKVFRCRSQGNSRKCRRRRDRPAMIPVMGGGYLTQDSSIKTFGLKRSKVAAVEIWWPSTKQTNQIVLFKGETVIVPQIACDIKDTTQTRKQFKRCVKDEKNRIKAAGIKFPKRYEKDMWDGFDLYNSGQAAAASVSTGSGSSNVMNDPVEMPIIVACSAAFVCLLVVACCWCRRQQKIKKWNTALEMAQRNGDVDIEREQSADGRSDIF